MNNRDRAIGFLREKHRENTGQQTEAQKLRAEAVAFLTGKTTQKKPLRPEVRALLGND